MKIGKDYYNFGRCVKITFSNGYSLEHAPELNRDKFVAMDISVSDRPSASAKDKPGFQGNVTIFNPSKELLHTISGGATWIQQYIKDNGSEAENYSLTKDFYRSRLVVTVEAGYVVDEGKNKKANYSTILKGYVMGSSLSHKGTDDVLSIGIYDIDIMNEPANIEKNYKKKTIADYVNESGFGDFADTWYKTLVKYIQLYETKRIPSRTDIPNIRRQMTYEISPAQTQENFPLSVDTSRTSYETLPYIDVSSTDRKKTDWFEIKFVQSLSDYLVAKRAGKDLVSARGIVDVDLEIDCKNLKMPNGSLSGANLAQMLDGLCAVEGDLGWYRDVSTDMSRNTYVIYRMSKQKSFVRGENAAIRIWNYQNLLESPSVDGAGCLTIKMIFNPECICLKTIALMLDTNLKTAVTRDISELTTGLLGSMATQTSGLSNYGNTQITGANAVAALRKEVSDATKKGYLFNTGFPIIKVEHRLSTYGKDWTTTVKTTPAIGGFRINKEN